VSESSDARVVLQPSCTIREAAALKSELLRVLDASTVVIDASAVAKIDTAGVQLLMTLVFDRRLASVATRWEGVTPPLRAAARSLGLESAMGFAG
jgi:anti-anti-sigma regulatory factor